MRQNARERIHRAAVHLFAQQGSERVSVAELAAAAGVARGTVYNQLEDPDTLFDHTASRLAAEMHGRIEQALIGVNDPALRVSTGIRLFIRRAHEEPDWGQFICRFGLSTTQLRDIWDAQPMQDLRAGIASERFTLAEEQLVTVTAILSGSVIAACRLVLAGYKGWREASSETAEFMLKALGVDSVEAHAIATADLSTLSPTTDPNNGE